MANFELDWKKAPQPPAGVERQSFHEKLLAAPDNDQLPALDALVIVEGLNDCRAVQRAVRSPVFVLGGGYALADEMKPELQYLGTLARAGQLPRQLVVFTDPDWQGRMFRTLLDDVLSSAAAASACPGQPASEIARRPSSLKIQGGTTAGGSEQAQGASGGSSAQQVVVRHAFLRVELGTREVASKYHEAGNVGVEHASPETIRACLIRARRGHGTARKEFSVEELQAEGLIGSWNDKQKVAGPQLRRNRFCQALGIDEVGSGKALVNLLNRFFSREEYSAALQAASEENVRG